jgi:magnesium transporter
MLMSDVKKPEKTVDSDSVRLMHPADIAELFEAASPAEHALILSVLDHEKRAELLVYLDANERRGLLDQRSPDEIANLIGDLDSDDAADLLGDLEEQTQIKVLKSLELNDPNEAQDVRTLMDHPADSAGGLMQTEIASITYGATAGEA